MRAHASFLCLCLVSAGCAAPRREMPTEPSLVGAMPSPIAPGAADTAVRFAEAQLGKRYCWGGAGPSCFDCSGLVQAAWHSALVKLPRTSDAQGRSLSEVPLDHVLPGDILWWKGHVGLYVGRGEMIDAYHSGAGVVRRRAVVPQRVLRVVLPRVP